MPDFYAGSAGASAASHGPIAWSMRRTRPSTSIVIGGGAGTADVDLAVLENVGNLVCPAEFDTGAVKNAMILSVPEGDDKPLKYPLIFTVCDALLINKTDVLPYFDFDMDKVVEYAHRRNPKLEIFPVSAKTGEGMDAWCDWLRRQVRAWQS